MNEQLISFLEQLPDYCNEYVEYKLSQNTKETTILQHLFDVRSFFRFLMEKFPRFKAKELDKFTLSELNALTESEIKQFAQWCTVELSPCTQKRKLTSLISFYDCFFQKGELTHNYFLVLHKPIISKEPDISVDFNHVIYFIDCIKTGTNLTGSKKTIHFKRINRNLLFVYLSIKYGLKNREITQLNISNFNLAEKYFVIERKNQLVRISYDKELAKILSNYLTEREHGYIKNENEDALFLTNRGVRLTVRSLQIIFKDFLDMADLQSYSISLLQDIYARNSGS